MNKEKDFFKTCFDIVAGLEVKNESQEIAKEVVLNEVENLQEENKNQKEVIDKAMKLTKNLLKTENRGYYQILFKEILKSLGDKE